MTGVQTCALPIYMDDDDANGLVWRLFQEINHLKRASILIPRRVPQIVNVLGEAILRPGKLEVRIELIHRSGFVVPEAILLTGVAVAGVDTRSDSIWADLEAEKVESDRSSSSFASSGSLGKDPDDGSE